MSSPADPVIVDLRSDVVTRPCSAMRRAIAEADVGDMVFGDDPSVNKLEAMAAEVMGKEAGLYVPSGTMSNLIGVMVHCWERGSEVLLGDKCHVFIFEQGGLAQFGGIHPRPLTTKPDGTFSLDELRSKVRSDDQHYPITRLVCIENSHNLCDGKSLPLEWLKEVGKTCQELNLPLHCDGARIFNAASTCKVDVKELVKECNSVSICLSKGLGAPVGSVLVGTKEFIQKAYRLRKALGGGMRNAGIIAAAGIYAIENNVSKLQRDHRNAKRMARVVLEHGGEIVTTQYDEKNCTNLLLILVDSRVMSAQELVQRFEKMPPAEVAALGGTSVKVCFGSFVPGTCRLAFHLDVTDNQMDLTEAKMVFVLKEIQEKAKQS